MQQLTLQEIQSVQLNLLKQFHAYCAEHELRYYLYAGTLLGAVRHKGYIPWDDDIDLMMPRPDYERLYALQKTDPLPQPLRLQSARETEHYNAPFFKVSDARTDGEVTYLRREIRCPVWIDLFPLDGLPEDEAEAQAHLQSLWRTQKTMEYVVRPFRWSRNPLRLGKRMWIWLRYHGMDYRAMANRMDTQAKRYGYDCGERVAVAVFDGIKRIFPRHCFEQMILLPFEDSAFCVPAEYDALLTAMYGDYRMPPPPEQRVSHHSYTAVWKAEGER